MSAAIKAKSAKARVTMARNLLIRARLNDAKEEPYRILNCLRQTQRRSEQTNELCSKFSKDMKEDGMSDNTIQATITEVWWSVDLGNEVTPMVHIVLPDKTEVVLRDQIANGWTVERMSLNEGVDLARILHAEEDDYGFYARYGDDAEFDFDTLRQVRRTLMQKGSEFFKEGYAQPIELRNVKQSALQPRQKRG